MRRFRPTHEPLEKRYALAASLSITGPTDAVFEGESLAYTLRLSEPSRQVETVFVSTADGTATYGSDYFAMASQQIQFSPGQMMKTVTVRTLRDSGRPLAEGVETLSVIARPANAALGTARAIGRIADFAPPPRISVGEVSLNEGNSGRSDATFTVTLSSAAVKTVTVAYATADLSATLADTDYVAASGTLTFAPGETQKTVSVGITGDMKLEPNETFSFTLSAPTNADLGTSRAFATIVNDEVDAPGFQIVVRYNSPLTASQKQAFDVAAARWSQIITGDLPGVTDSTGAFIDDVVIDARVVPIDGVGGVLGQAGPRDIRPGSGGLPYSGAMQFDSADLAGLEASGQLRDTILHEMAHVLGFGTLWNTAGLLSGTADDPRYIGINAVREYNALAGATVTSVPVENTGGTGTAFSHWREAVFGAELMTGFLNSRTANPISRVTIGQFQDLGYQVSYGAADSYTLPPVAMAAIASQSSSQLTQPASGSTPQRTVFRVLRQQPPAVVGATRR